MTLCHECYNDPYSTAKETRKFVTLKLIRNKYVEFKKYILHVKLTVFYTVSFTCNIYFMNLTYFISINLKVTSFRVTFAAGYTFCV